MFGGQSSAGGDDGFAGWECANLGYDTLAFLQDRRSARAVNRSIHASAAEQGRVGGVDYGFGCLFGDVGRAMEFERLAVGEGQSGCEVGHSGKVQVLRSQVSGVRESKTNFVFIIMVFLTPNTKT